MLLSCDDTTEVVVKSSLHTYPDAILHLIEMRGSYTVPLLLSCTQLKNYGVFCVYSP